MSLNQSIIKIGQQAKLAATKLSIVESKIKKKAIIEAAKKIK